MAAAMRTGFNGFGNGDTVVETDERMASNYVVTEPSREVVTSIREARS